ncbi:MAG TPA: CHAT domain-containing protein [Vicinamibacterales bacterium]|nr:CHAT domain-containing protein [Vicinamibacterales bacterium]
MQAAITRRVRWLIVSVLAMRAAASAEASALPQLDNESATVSRDVQQQLDPPKTSAAAAVVEGTRLLDGRQSEAARQQFERALELARTEHDREAEGRAYRGLGAALLNLSKYPAAKDALDRALEIFDGTDAHADLARVHRELGTVEYFLNHPDVSRSHYKRALAEFQAVGDVASQAAICNSLTFVTDDDERTAYTRKGLELARQVGAVETEARLLHSWSDLLFQRGRLSEASDNLDLAIARFEAAGDSARANFARALTSLGRLHRAHGQHDQALAAYQRAFQIQEALDERSGMIQSLNAIAAAYVALGKRAEVRPLLERALALAIATGSPLIIDFQKGALGRDLIETADDPARGLEILEEVVSRDPHRYYGFFYYLASGYLALGQYSRAVESADLAISQAREHGILDLVPAAFAIRAKAREKLGQYTDALSDVREAIALIERMRTDVVATDALKRGFAEQHQWFFTHAIQLLHHLGRDREALETAEQGRARAFADLLASRESAQAPAARAEPAPARADLPHEATGGPDGLKRRGAETTSSAPGLHSDRDLQSLASATPLSSDDLVELTARLHSTLVSYWVAPDATYVWVVRPSGEITGQRIEVTERRLLALVRQTWMTDASGVRGEVLPSATSDRDDAVESPEVDWTPRVRGEGLLSFGERARVASRALYGLLIAPIQPLLPAKPGSLLTIIPHGPLFRLSFAALQNPARAYLVERHAIHYVPAGVVLELAEEHARPSQTIAPRYLLLADPTSTPPLPSGRPLPRLPGTQKEIGRVSAFLPASAVTALVGAQATEHQVRSLAGDRSVLHFATHGVIRADDPLESFLALDTGRTGRDARQSIASDTADDGRLTAREIYGIQLNADLVVLSACRTGLGAVSGDGVIGLARAFLYAGTPSVIATLWDVADEPAARLMPNLYRSLKRVPDTAQALRRAQLTLLNDLRNGRVKVHTKSGTTALAEHPILWASFILVGKP